MSVAGISPEETVSPLGEDAYAAAADEWAATQPAEADDAESAAHRLYDIALTFQERSQIAEARILEQFEAMVAGLADHLGDLVIIDDDDERLTFTGAGRLVAEVIPEGPEGEWRKLATPEELVEFYDPTDVFGDVADAIAEAYPAVAPELDDEDRRRRATRPTTRARTTRSTGEPLTERAGNAACSWSTRSSSRAGRSCPASGSSSTTRRRSPARRGRASSSTSGPATGRGSSCAGRSRSTPRTRPRAPSRSTSARSGGGRPG